MFRGVLTAFGIMMVLGLIPIVDIIGIPFGAFIGGYYGASLLHSRSGSYAANSLILGMALGLLVFLMLLAVAIGLTTALTLEREFLWILWLAVVVFTLYTASMGALGAMYAQLRKAN